MIYWNPSNSYMSRGAGTRAKEAAAKHRSNEAAKCEAKFDSEATGMSSYDLCVSYRNLRYKFGRAELVGQAALTAKEWELVDRKTIQIGISELAPPRR